MNSACEIVGDSQACPFVYSDGLVAHNTPHDVLSSHYVGWDFWFIFNKDFRVVVDMFHIDLLKDSSVSKLQWYPVSVSFSDYKNHSYYLTTVFIIDVLEKLIKQEKKVIIRYNLGLFRQCFLFLMIHVEETGETLNDKLDTERILPSLGKIFHEGNIKNIINRLLECNYLT